MKRQHMTAEEINRVRMAQKQALDTAADAMNIITLVILREEYKWGPKRLNDFMDRFQDVLDYYNGSDDYQALLMEWNDYFYDYAGIKILPRKDDK